MGSEVQQMQKIHKKSPCRCGYTDKGRVAIAHHEDTCMIAYFHFDCKGVLL